MSNGQRYNMTIFIRDSALWTVGTLQAVVDALASAGIITTAYKGISGTNGYRLTLQGGTPEQALTIAMANADVGSAINEGFVEPFSDDSSSAGPVPLTAPAPAAALFSGNTLPLIVGGAILLIFLLSRRRS